MMKFPKPESQAKLRKTLIKKLDTIVARKVKERDNHTCVRCGSNTKQLNACHFYSRSIKSLRWDMDNIICLCVGCHFWAHKNPSELTDWYRTLIGDSRFGRLMVKKSNRFKTSVMNLKLLLHELEK